MKIWLVMLGMITIQFSCNYSAKNLADCNYERLDKFELLDTIVKKNLSILPPAFSNWDSRTEIDSIQIKCFSKGGGIGVAAFSYATKDLYLIFLKNKCLDLEGYNHYYTGRRQTSVVEFIKSEEIIIAVIEGKEIIYSDTLTAFSDTIYLPPTNAPH